MNLFPVMRIGIGYDIHRLEEGLPLYLGGIRINHFKGCVAHSDGDVLIHSLCDALLGAAGLRDIGYHFPDNDPLFKNISSTILLGRVVEIIKNEGWEIINIDTVINLERPKISDYIEGMRQNLSDIIGINKNAIGIKATTAEGLGAVGNEEALSCYSVVILSGILHDSPSTEEGI